MDTKVSEAHMPVRVSAQSCDISHQAITSCPSSAVKGGGAVSR